jgi:hypothetical protein
LKEKQLLVLLFAFLLLAGMSAQALAVYPGGVDNVTILASQRNTPRNGTAIVGQGGNITWVQVTHNQQTRVWQGFVGNVSGSIALNDAANETLYSWTLINVSGEIFASRNSTVNWNLVSIQNDCTVDESLTGTRSDRVNRTFNASSNVRGYQIVNLVVNASTICAALPFVNNTRQASTTLFENTILTTGTTPNGNKSIYVGWLENGISGFDGQDYNFQLIVPINQTSGFTTYYMYAELD